MIRNKDGRWNAQTSDMKFFMGLDPKDKWPKDGLPPRIVQGWKVWVAPLSKFRIDNGFHRVRAQCPNCSQVMSAGRTHQHKCVKAA